MFRFVTGLDGLGEVRDSWGGGVPFPVWDGSPYQNQTTPSKRTPPMAHVPCHDPN